MKAAGDHEPAPIALREALSERYLAYALSTITARSLPDVRDGLKPVQRRLLYAMLQLRLDPAAGFKKCARVVGDVIGKFHPHGDVAVYDALVRLAQDFSQRYPLVDGQGNFGNVDGDNAAAMRYTESRLTAIAGALLEAIDEDAVDFRPTYDGSESEPVVLPAAFPNLLANGAAGIAVGMATSIPPHNAGELLDALILLLERPPGRPSPAAADVMTVLRGPDLPTGGSIIENPEDIAEAYRSGRGALRLRARWEIERLAHGQYQIVVNEIPYVVPKARLVERLAELLAARKLPFLADLRDESTQRVRLVFTPRSRSVPPEQLMEQLFRESDLETRINLNMNVLDAAGVPRVMGIVELLQAFIDHRMEVLVRRSRYRLERIDERLEIIDGYLRIFLDLDRVIAIIREQDEPRAALMRAFELTERQADAVLNLRLRQLRRLEQEGLEKEQRRLRGERRRLERLLGNDSARRAALVEEMRETKKRFGDSRRTIIAAPPTIDPVLLEEPVERTPLTVICSAKGWIRTMRGHGLANEEIKYKDGDGERFVIEATSTDRLVIATTDGRCYLLPVDRLPGGRGLGEPIALSIDIARGADLCALFVHQPQQTLALVTRHGRGFLAVEGEITAQTRAGKQVVNIGANDRLAFVRRVSGSHLALVTTNSRMLLIPLDDIPTMTRARGVLLQRLKEGEVSDVACLEILAGLSWTQGSRTRRQTDLSPWVGKRGQTGKRTPQGFPKDNRFASVGALASR